MRASNPVDTVVKPEAVGPVRDVKSPTVTELLVTPGALLPLLLLPAPAWPTPLVLVPLLLLEHAAADNDTSTAAPASAAVRRLILLTSTMLP
jgi:hypothetical protein